MTLKSSEINNITPGSEKQVIPDIFTYLDYRTYLKDLCALKKINNPHFSYRYLSKKLNIRSAGYFSWVLQGKRNISGKLLLDLAAFFKMNKNQTEYFELLVNYNQAGTYDERKRNFLKLLSMRRGVVKQVENDKHEFYLNWYYSALRELVQVVPVNDENMSDTAKMLSPQVPTEKMRQSIELLVRLGFISKNEKGFYTQVHSAISSKGSIEPIVIQNYQISCMNLAAEAFDSFEQDERQMSTVTMSIDKDAYEIILDRIASLRAEIMETACSVSKPDRVMQLNFQFFPLTRIHRK
ncbi:MAG TPA: TIGR02147 family protein [Chitinispirillaceae bacterium]|jgi:uncharacterized protein (TIGR02147 family)|nr:TIGR02147 family protein [Chitinispirillaceae bacterium]